MPLAKTALSSGLSPADPDWENEADHERRRYAPHSIGAAERETAKRSRGEGECREGPALCAGPKWQSPHPGSAQDGEPGGPEMRGRPPKVPWSARHGPAASSLPCCPEGWLASATKSQVEEVLARGARAGDVGTGPVLFSERSQRSPAERSSVPGERRQVDVDSTCRTLNCCHHLRPARRVFGSLRPQFLQNRRFVASSVTFFRIFFRLER